MSIIGGFTVVCINNDIIQIRSVAILLLVTILYHTLVSVVTYCAQPHWIYNVHISTIHIQCTHQHHTYTMYTLDPCIYMQCVHLHIGSNVHICTMVYNVWIYAYTMYTSVPCVYNVHLHIGSMHIQCAHWIYVYAMCTLDLCVCNVHIGSMCMQCAHWIYVYAMYIYTLDLCICNVQCTYVVGIVFGGCPGDVVIA